MFIWISEWEPWLGVWNDLWVGALVWCMFVWISEWEPWHGVCFYGSLCGSPGLVDPWVGALAWCMFVWISDWEPWPGVCLYGSLCGSPGLVDPWVGTLVWCMFVWIPEWEPWLGICLYGSLSGSPGLVYVCMDPWVGALAWWISEWEGTLAWCTFKWVLVVSVFWHWWSCWHGNQFVMSLCPTSARCVGLPISHPNSYHRYNPSLHLLTCSTLSYLPNILFLILSISVLALLNIRMGSYPSLSYLVCCMWACAQTYWNLVWWICYSKLPETVPRCWLIGPSIPTCIYLWAHPRGRKSHILCYSILP